MNIKYYYSITQEIEALKNRILEYTTHRLSNGEWRESILRRILRRHLPQKYKVGRGFVITEKGPSTQIDVLIYDTSKPILYQEGDFIIITLDAVIGVIEVKTKSYKEPTKKLTKNIKLFKSSTCCVNKRIVTPSIFYAYYSFEKYDPKKILLNPLNKVHFLCLGNSLFIRYWDVWEKRIYNKWHVYKIKDETAPAYFIYSIIDYIESNEFDYPVSNNLWFPEKNLEDYLVKKVS